jgi:cobyrinic acid a,c-diamide synthase
MYLCKSVAWEDKNSEMVGVIDANIVMNKRPQGRGYVCLKRTDDFLWSNNHPQNEQISAHEFHYSGFEDIESIDSNPNIKYAYEMKRGSGISGLHDGVIYKNLLANYAHLRDTSRFHWVSEFVDFIRQVKS